MLFHDLIFIVQALSAHIIHNVGGWGPCGPIRGVYPAKVWLILNPQSQLSAIMFPNYWLLIYLAARNFHVRILRRRTLEWADGEKRKSSSVDVKSRAREFSSLESISASAAACFLSYTLLSAGDKDLSQQHRMLFLSTQRTRVRPWNVIRDERSLWRLFFDSNWISFARPFHHATRQNRFDLLLCRYRVSHI